MANDFYTQLAELILYHRKQTGLNREELAQLAGVGKTAIYDIEHAKQTVRLNTLVKLLNVLNIEINLSSKLLQNKKMNYEKS